MADFGGFEIETPQEVLARLQEQRAQALQSRDPVQRAMARTDMAFDVIFGNVAAKRAEKQMKSVAEAVKKAQERLPESASDIERARARLQAAQSVLEETDPAQAMKIEQRLLELDAEEFERNRLLASDERAAEVHELRKEEHEAEMARLEREEALARSVEGARVAVYGTMANPQIRGFNLGTERGRAAWEQFQEEHPDALLVDPETAFRELFGASSGGDRGGSMSKHEARRLRQRASSSLDLLSFANEYLGILRNNPDAFSLAEQGAGVLDNLTRQLQSAASVVRDIAADNGWHTDNVKRVNQKLAEAGIDQARIGGLAVNLAYTFAKNMDPGGRLSDQDIDRAMEMIGGKNITAEGVAATLKDSVGIQSASVLRDLQLLDDTDQVPFAKHMALLDAERREFLELADSFSERREPRPDPQKVARDHLGRPSPPRDAGPQPVQTPSGAIVGGDY